MSEALTTLEQQDGVATLTLDRPAKRNALSRAMRHELVARLTELEADGAAALGGGCDLAAMCDVRLAATAAVFGQPQVRFGGAAAYDLMREVLPTGAAREIA